MDSFSRFFERESIQCGPVDIRDPDVFLQTFPVSAIALRGRTNERSEFLLTTLPVADPDLLSSATAFFPHYADGGGWKTQFVLVNPIDEPMTGILKFVQQDGQTTDAVPLRNCSSISMALYHAQLGSNNPRGVGTSDCGNSQRLPLKAPRFLSYERERHPGFGSRRFHRSRQERRFRLFFESSAAGDVSYGYWSR